MAQIFFFYDALCEIEARSMERAYNESNRVIKIETNNKNSKVISKVRMKTRKVKSSEKAVNRFCSMEKNRQIKRE